MSPPQQQVSLEVTEPSALFNDPRPVANRFRPLFDGLSWRSQPPFTMPQILLPGFSFRALPLDPAIDRAGGNVTLRLWGEPLSLSSADLVRRPTLDQAVLHRVANLRPIQLQRSFSVPPLGLGLSDHRTIHAVATMPRPTL